MTREFTKSVDVAEKIDDEQVAISAVLVPGEVDRQGDFLRPTGVRNLYNPDADIGVMHSVFPDDAASSEHRILEESETIGGKIYPGGTWVERRKYHDDELWQLVKDGILEGRSIGGRVSGQQEFGPDEVPDDVEFGDGAPRDEVVAEILDGSVREVSDVDVPAVPSAEHAVVKSLDDLEKNIYEESAGEREFVERMTDRGHSEEDARQLWQYLESVDGDENVQQDKNDTMSDSDPDDAKTDEPDDVDETSKQDDSLDEMDDATLGQRLKSVLRLGDRSDDGAQAESAESEETTPAEKAGRTLSRSNQRAIMASIDAQLDVLNDAGMEHGMTRFSDREDVDFNVAEFGDGGEEMEQAEDAEKDSDQTTGAESPADDETDTNKMSDDNTTDDDNEAGVEEKLDALAEKIEQLEKDDDGEDDEEPTIEEKVDKLAERVDRIANEAADSDQTEKSTDSDEEPEDGLDAVAKILG